MRKTLLRLATITIGIVLALAGISTPISDTSQLVCNVVLIGGCCLSAIINVLRWGAAEPTVDTRTRRPGITYAEFYGIGQYATDQRR